MDKRLPALVFSAGMRRDCLFVTGLILLTFACFWPAGSLGFIDLDDYDYVSENPIVQSGLNYHSVAWACRAVYASNWHPITWLSHMLDCELFGLNPHEEHWVNVGFHAVNAALLFLWLRGLTGARWRSLLVAALFAVHPLHVQSVAWISERKDVLSGFFFMLILLAYTRYCRRQNTGNFLLVGVLLALGLMAKPMLVTVPLVLLLVDFWPLKRFAICPPAPGFGVTSPPAPGSGATSDSQIAIFRNLVREKIPWFVLCLICCLITLRVQHVSAAMAVLAKIPLWDRFLQALLAYSLYLGKIFWPINLAIYYPLSFATPNVLAVLGAGALLAMLFLAAGWRRQDQPWLLAGWAWFVVMLLPVIGVVQTGFQAMADRYAYLPSIGLFVAVVWGLAELAPRLPAAFGGPPAREAGSASSRRRLRVLASESFWRAALLGLGAACLLACGLDSRYQLGFWRDSRVLFQHALDVSPKDNFLGYYYLGTSYGKAGRLEAAASCLAASLKINPEFEPTRRQMGNVLLLQKKYAAARPFLEQTARNHPDSFMARRSLGDALAGLGEYLAARPEYQAALQLRPEAAQVKELLAANAPKADAEQTLNELTGQLTATAAPEIHARAAQAQCLLGRHAEAVQQYHLALAQRPDSVEWLNNLAWLLATCPEDAIRNGSEAMFLARHACDLTQNRQTVCLGTLAAACAEAGRFDEAVLNAKKACDQAAAQGETGLLELNQKLLARYQNHQPYRDNQP